VRGLVMEGRRFHTYRHFLYRRSYGSVWSLQRRAELLVHAYYYGQGGATLRRHSKGKHMNKFRESNRKSYVRAIVVVAVVIVITATSMQLRANTGPCGGVPTTLPFTDVPVDNVFFCAIASAYFSGLTNGTTATTYAPTASVPREQMAAFVTRTMDQSLKRGSKRAALDQYWTTQVATNLGLTDVGDGPALVRSDGDSLWVANAISGTISRVQASNGKVVQTWTGATNAI